MSIFKKLFGGEPPKKEPLPVNEAFSVVSGILQLKGGATQPFSAVVPTVFGGDSDDVVQATGGARAVEETVGSADIRAREQYPGSKWLDENDLKIREATDAEREWALANGVNQRFGAG